MADERDIIAIRNAVENITQILAGKGIEVTQRGARAYVSSDRRTHKPIRVNLPFIPDNASDDLMAAIHGFLDHEVAHLLFTDFKVITKANKLGKKTANLHNIIEDSWIERAMCKKFKGSAFNLDNVGDFFLEKYTTPMLEQAIAQGDMRNIVGVLMVPAVRAWSGNQTFIDFMKDKWEYMEQVTDKLGKELIDEIPKLKSSTEALSLTEKMLEKMKEEQPPGEEGDDEDESDDGESSEDGEASESGKGESKEPEDEEDESEEGEEKPEDEEEKPEDEEDESKEEEEPEDGEEKPEDGEDKPEDEEESPEDEEGKSEGGEGDSEGEEEKPEDGEDDEDGEEGKSGGKPEDEDSEDEESKGGGESEDEDEDSEGSSGEGEDEAESEEDKMSGEELMESIPDEDFDDLVANELTKKSSDSAANASYLPFTKDYDTIEKFEVKETEWRDDYLIDIDETTSTMTGPLQKNLERLIIAKSQSRWQPGLRSGRINTSSLYRLKNKDMRVFRKREISETTDTDVSLVVDCSGSMHGSKIELAMIAAYALSTVLDRLGINHEVIGFTTSGFGRMPADLQAEITEEERRLGRGFSRYEPIRMSLFKEFGEKLSVEQRRRIAVAPHSNFLYNNIDGESVELAAQRLARQPGTGKLLMVLSDGMPAGYGNHTDLDNHLVEVVKKLEKQMDVIGLGIETDSVKDYYTNYAVLNDAHELPVKVMGELKRALLK